MEMARLENWDTRTLDQKIDSLFYERTALSRKPEEVIKQEFKSIEGKYVIVFQGVDSYL